MSGQQVPLPPLSKGGGAAAPEGFPPVADCFPLTTQVGAGHARPARFRKKLCWLRQPVLPPTTPATSTSRPRGIAHALKTARGAVFAPRYAGRGAATCGYRIRLRPLGGACLMRPLRLLRIPVSAAGGGRLRSRLFDSRMGHLLRPTPIKKAHTKKKALPQMK